MSNNSNNKRKKKELKDQEEIFLPEKNKEKKNKIDTQHLKAQNSNESTKNEANVNISQNFMSEEEFEKGILNDGTNPDKPARVYVDGIFDLFHFGHAKALQQAKKLFPYTYLIVGVCNDEITHRLKGKTVMTDVERVESVKHCRYVDEVIPNAPWVVDKNFMLEHGIEYIAHGEDASLDENGKDVYEFAKKIGRFKFIKRTEGISTTDLIMRIIKEYDEYVRRNLKRGCSRKDLNVGLLKEKQIIYGSKIKELKKKATEELEEIKEKFEENHLFEFLKKFGKIFEGETFPC